MNESKFWQLLEYAKAKSNGDIKEQRQIIANLLAELDLEEIMEFYCISLEKEALIYSCDIWDAACLIMGGCSDDSFDDFQEWLVSQGEAIFYKTLENPDNLANLFTDQTKFDYQELILFSSIGMAYEIKTGQNEEEIPPPLRLPERELKGEFCTKNGLKEKYPRLFALYKRWHGEIISWA